MNTNIKYLAITLLYLSSVLSCQKADPVTHDGNEIVIGVNDEFTVDTKATAIESIPATLYWGASTGTSTETVKWSAASASVSSSKINTGKYQSVTPTSYNYYVANQTFTVAGAMTVANNNTDIIVGRTASSTSTTPSVTLNHIFARTGTLTCNTQSGYSISGISWKIVSKGSITGTAGTYNMKSQSWTASSATLSEQTFTSLSDLYLIPGTYTIKVSYTLSKGGSGEYSQSFTKQADVTLVGGKVNNITVTAIGGDASEIVISLSLTAWGSQTLTPSLS